MNADTAEAVSLVVALAQNTLVDEYGTAIAVVDDAAFIGDYWADDGQFTNTLSDALTAAQRIVFAIPIITRHEGDALSFRRPDGVLLDTEDEQLFMLACDLESGLDVLRCQIEREAAPRLGDAELYTGQLQLHSEAPGFQLVRALLPNGEVNQ